MSDGGSDADNMAKHNVKFAARMLGKNPGFTAVAVITLGLGIGANTAIFSVVNAVLLKPLPYSDADRMIFVSQTQRQPQITGVPVSFTKYEQIRAQSQTLESTAAYYPLTLSLVTQREPEAIFGARVTMDFFKVLGISPTRGRTFDAAEETPGGSDAAVISDGFWHSHFGGDDMLLGRTVTLDGKNVTVVGILPAGFRFPLQFPEPDVWLPRVDENTNLRPEQIRTGAGYLSVIGKLRAGSTLEQAQAELKTIDGRYRAQFGSYVDATKLELAATSLKDSLVSGLRTSLLVLLAAIGFVLLIACVNVANLLMARATSREKEIAIRKALGASKSRLVAQLLIESMLLSFAGGAAGVLLAETLLPLLRTLQPGTFPRVGEAHLDAGVLLFTADVVHRDGNCFWDCAVVAGGGPRTAIVTERGRAGAVRRGAGGGRVRSMLVIGEIAVALVLMTGAGLLMASFAKLMDVNPGFVAKNVTVFPITLPPNRYGGGPQQAQFYRQLVEKTKSIPGYSRRRPRAFTVVRIGANRFLLRGRASVRGDRQRSAYRGAASDSGIFQFYGDAAVARPGISRKRSGERDASGHRE